MDLEKQLGAMIRDPGEAEAIRRADRDDIPKNALGMDARPGGGSFLFSYPCMILAGRKPG